MADPGQHSPRRFHSLDALRGLAALSVVFWHWRHFVPDHGSGVEGTSLPLSALFFFFYAEGWRAVDLFFCLSGFVFFWRYSEVVARRGITSRDFAVLRFSRLYPLHFATLLLVAAGQAWMMNTRGSFFTFHANDARHFVLNLLFASSWGFERGASFNAPIWSVSVEIVLYAMFFVYCRLFPIRLALVSLPSIAGFLLVSVWYPPLGRGLGFFFLGGCTFLLYRRIAGAGHARQVMWWAACLTGAAWLLAVIASMMGAHGTEWLSVRSAPFFWRFDAYVSLLVIKLPAIALFPSTILTLALIERSRGSFGKRVAFLGDISYSTYLLHFPLQLLAAGLAANGIVSGDWFSNPWFLAAFLGALVAASLATYHFFELPMQEFLRRRLLAKREKASQEAGRWEGCSHIIHPQLGHNT